MAPPGGRTSQRAAAESMSPDSGSSSSSSVIKNVLTSPASWVKSYDGFITRNSGQVSQIESALRSLTYIIPGRFGDAEITSETLHSGVQLLSLYHDNILERAHSNSPPPPSPIQNPNFPSSRSSRGRSGSAAAPTQHTRYTRFWTSRSPVYRHAAQILQVVTYTQLLCEMTAKRRGGERYRWRVVVVLEVIKALCKLVMLKITKCRAIVSPPLPEREPLRPDEGKSREGGFDEDGTLSEILGTPLGVQAERALNPMAERSKAAHEKESVMPRTGTTLPPLPDPRDITSYLLSRVLTADDIKPATALLNRLGGSAQVAEVLHILAPVAYAVSLAASPDKRSWAPWVIGISIECAARQLRGGRQDAAGPNKWGLGGFAPGMSGALGQRPTALEREEWNKRGWSLGWWAMRGPFYDHLVKGVVDGVRDRVPSFVGNIVHDYEYLWESYHFSTST